VEEYGGINKNFLPSEYVWRYNIKISPDEK